ncbi:hypothetical protein DPMN_022964 [Dreissena polymorpha]|uniref:Uncharacterized protein n=1 Tax=Dreissena polymorpha TaxID=45954 RepID=A0A9D4R9I0_DREPO|nr:hypothetical protein DPMN_022964 [Dreissena polymorpha]
MATTHNYLTEISPLFNYIPIADEVKKSEQVAYEHVCANQADGRISCKYEFQDKNNNT